MKVKRKAQAALEFLTTYGWAFMVILILISTISYFGVTNPKKFLPERCTFSTEVICTDHLIKGSESQVKIKAKQTTGSTIFLEDLTCSFEGEESTEAKVEFEGKKKNLKDEDFGWGPRDEVVAKCSFPGDTFKSYKDRKVKIYIDLTYRLSKDGFPHQISGELFGTVQ